MLRCLCVCAYQCHIFSSSSLLEDLKTYRRRFYDTHFNTIAKRRKMYLIAKFSGFKHSVSIKDLCRIQPLAEHLTKNKLLCVLSSWVFYIYLAAGLLHGGRHINIVVFYAANRYKHSVLLTSPCYHFKPLQTDIFTLCITIKTSIIILSIKCKWVSSNNLYCYMERNIS